MQSPADPLRVHAPNPVIERIFARLHLSYGSLWLRLYEGLDARMVAADWNRELSVFASPVGLDAIAWALDNLPSGGPPTCLRFRDLVRQAPRAIEALALPPPPADPDRVRAALASLRRPGEPVDRKAWISNLQARVVAGDRLNYRQRQILRELAARPPLSEEALGDSQ